MLTALLRRVAFVLWTLVLTVWAFSAPPDNRSPWSQIVEINAYGSLCYKDCHVKTLNDSSFDLTSPRQWMEYLEATKGRGGAYTVLRCDCTPNNNKRRIWGRDFHMNRLCQSYCTLIESTNQLVSQDQLDLAVNSTNAILDTLVEQATLTVNKAITNSHGWFTIMLTILWQRDTSKQQAILVRGHALCNGMPIATNDDQFPDAITATLAISYKEDDLPNRYNHYPEAKLSSWCRRRRPLEERFKVNGASEVVLTKRVGDEIHILEGLTSNIFFLYPHKKLRTANTDVLKGFARELVLDCAAKLGFEYDSSPIRIQDYNLWREIFVTSSVRLVVPIKRLLIPDEQKGDLFSLWTANDNEHPTCKLFHKVLLKDQW